MRPLRFVDGDGVAVAHDQQRPLPAVAFQPRDQVGPLRIGADDRRRNPFLLEHALDVSGDDDLVARGLRVSRRSTAW